VDALVLSCLEKNPDDRPQDAAEIVSLIDNCHVAEAWSGDRAQEWWATHVPDITGAPALEKGFDIEPVPAPAATSAETRL
jgi:hypothetical protein